MTPLWKDPADNRITWKREDLNPTGSFKDRGAESLMDVAVRSGARELVLDSSGNAALAAARMAAVVGLPLRLHVPRRVPQAKLEAYRLFGASVTAGGVRADAADRAAKEAGERFWFSHVYHPGFVLGTRVSGEEVLAAGHDARIWVVPVGNGSLLLGLAAALRAARATHHRLIAVQAAACAGLRPDADHGSSRAGGIAIADPPRRAEILEAVADTGGDVVEVSEPAIESSRQVLASRGVRVEPAAAATLAAIEVLQDRGETGSFLGWLTGSGARG